MGRIHRTPPPSGKQRATARLRALRPLIDAYDWGIDLRTAGGRRTGMPRMSDPAAPMPEGDGAAPADDAAHLLLVDDDRRIRDLLSRYLRKEGYRVTLAENAAEARTHLRFASSSGGRQLQRLPDRIRNDDTGEPRGASELKPACRHC